MYAITEHFSSSAILALFPVNMSFFHWLKKRFDALDVRYSKIYLYNSIHYTVKSPIYAIHYFFSHYTTGYTVQIWGLCAIRVMPWSQAHTFFNSTCKKHSSPLPSRILCHNSWTPPVFTHSDLVTFTSECKQVHVVNTTSQIVITSTQMHQ